MIGSLWWHEWHWSSQIVIGYGLVCPTWVCLVTCLPHWKDSPINTIFLSLKRFRWVGLEQIWSGRRDNRLNILAGLTCTDRFNKITCFARHPQWEGREWGGRRNRGDRCCSEQLVEQQQQRAAHCWSALLGLNIADVSVRGSQEYQYPRESLWNTSYAETW